MKRSLRMIVAIVLVVTQSSYLMAVQPPQPSEPSVLAPAALALIQNNVPAGEYEEFRILLNHYFRVYQQESLPKQQRFASELNNALLTSDFDTNVVNATKAENQSGSKSIEQQVDDAEAQTDGPLATALTAVIQNLLTGTNSDFNHKIVTLAGIYITDPLSAPAVFTIFKTINDQYDNNAAFRNLIITSEPAQQFLVGLKWAGAAAFILTIVNPRAWPYIADTWNGMTESWGGLFRSLRGALPDAAEDANADVLDTAKMLKRINIIAKKDPARAQALTEIMQMRLQISGLETELESIGYKGAQNVTDSQLLQEAMSNDAKARAKFEERMKERNFKLKIGENTEKYQRAARIQTLLRFLGLSNPKWQFVTLMKLMGMASVGGVINVAGHHMGLQRLYNHLYGPERGWKYELAKHMPGHLFDFTTRLVPVDSGALLPNSKEKELLNTTYNALDALNFSCNVDAFTKHISMYNRQLATEELAEYLLWYQFLSANTIYGGGTNKNGSANLPPKRCVPANSGIHYDPATKQIVMSIFGGQIKDHFSCEKFAAGIGGNCLAVSLGEAYSQLRATYSQIQKLPLAAPHRF